MAGSVVGTLNFCCTISRDVGGGVKHPVFYAKFNGALQGQQPDQCTPDLFGADVSDALGKSLRDQVLFAASMGMEMSVGGAGELVTGHPSEKISFVYVVF